MPTSEECCREDGVYERRPKPARSREWIRRIDPHKMTVVSSSVHDDRKKEKKETEEKIRAKGCESRQPLLLIQRHVVSADADGLEFDHHTVRER